MLRNYQQPFQSNLDRSFTIFSKKVLIVDAGIASQYVDRTLQTPSTANKKPNLSEHVKRCHKNNLLFSSQQNKAEIREAVFKFESLEIANHEFKGSSTEVLLLLMNTWVEK